MQGRVDFHDHETSQTSPTSPTKPSVTVPLQALTLNPCVAILILSAQTESIHYDKRFEYRATPLHGPDPNTHAAASQKLAAKKSLSLAPQLLPPSKFNRTKEVDLWIKTFEFYIQTNGIANKVFFEEDFFC